MPKQLKKTIWFPTREALCGKLIFSCVTSKYKNTPYTLVWGRAWHLCQRSLGNISISLCVNSNQLKDDKGNVYLKIHWKKITKATWTCLASCVKMVFWKGDKSSLCLLLVTLIMGSANQRKEGCRDHFRWTHWGSTYTWGKVMDFWECKDPDPHPHSCSQLQTATSSPAQPLLTP